MSVDFFREKYTSIKSFKGKEENAGNQRFVLFPQRFLPVLKQSL